MVDVFTKEDRSKIMARVRAKDTAPELKVRRLLHALGYRYVLHAKNLSGRPDVVFTRRRMAIFIHGCFWHQHPGCKAAARPASNVEYWRQKLTRNVARDISTREVLGAAGWRVLVIWECEINGKGKEEALTRNLIRFLGATKLPRK